jgi:hypothetical protein
MKEGIYIILLQNRETILNGAVVESNLKVLIRQEQIIQPIFPKKDLLLGFLI